MAKKIQGLNIFQVAEKKDKFKELKRKLFHLIMGLIVVFGVVFVSETLVFWTAVVVLILGFMARGRLFSGRNIPVLEDILKIFERDKVMREDPGRGALYFTLSVVCLLAIFSRDTAVASLLVLSISDSLSTIIGYYFGKIYLNDKRNKTLEGSSSFFVSCFIILFFYLKPAQALICAIMVTFVEFVPGIDDNLSVPLSTALLMKLLTL